MSDINPAELHSLFDYKDGVLTWKQGRKKGKVAGSLKPTGYTVVEIKNQNIMAHRLVWIMHNGSIDGQVDHINGNRSDNRIENLRVVTDYQNQWNRKIGKNNTIGIKGIRLRKDNNKYEARLCVNNKRIVLGSFDDLELAELVVMEARDKYHGKFANHG
jgi:hypothetical protein